MRAGRFEAIVFDFDGTLAELHLDFGEMKRRLSILAQEYLEPLPQPLPLPALEWLEIMVSNVRNVNLAAADELNRRAKTLIVGMELESARRGNLFPSTRPLLDYLRRRSVKVAIITRNCEEAVRVVFPDLESYCSGFLSRDHVPRVKPDPDHLLRALALLSVSPEAALMVGDHPLDVETGQRAGVPTAGVWSGNASQSDLSASGARWTARSCEVLIRDLTAMNLI